ncbi:hypothetical protein EYC80_007600 [Monilinia laxa]|uniref:Uncharacterized protein n=1 Tax=Monilinia laxa TaxID=61186 RepID=A0A5N6JWE5_MONLA|nr:hypothetical protein EYC80_007600 [Monilinia laxa]
MEEPGKIVQLAKIVVVFPNIGTEDLVANAVQVLPDVAITVVTSGSYLNDPPSDEWLDERDALNGEAPELISPEEADYALSQMIVDMLQTYIKIWLCYPRR